MAAVGNTIRHAVDAFKNYVEDRTGRQKDEISLPNYLIYYYLNLYNNRVQYEDRMRKGVFDYDESVAETIPCVELEELDLVECPCAPASGCTFFRSKFPLPRMMNEGLPVSITTLNGGNQFDYIRWYNFKDKVNSRNKREREGFYYTVKTMDKDLYLYVYRSGCFEDLNAIALSGVFIDPLEVACFPICSEEERPLCNPLDEKFIIDKDFESYIYEQTYNAIGMMRNLGAGGDIINNDNNDSQAQTGQE